MNTMHFRRAAGWFLLAGALFLLPQCKKSSSTGGSGNSGGYYLKFKINGTPVEYTSDAYASINKVNGDGLYGAELIAYQNINAGAKDAVTIILFSSSPIVANASYNDPTKATETNGSQVPESVIFWYDSTGTSYLTAGAISDANGNTPLTGVVANSQLTITELTSADLKGTFAGTVYRPDFATSESITDGEFYLKREQ